MVVRLPESARADLALLAQLPVPGAHGPVPLGNVAAIGIESGPARELPEPAGDAPLVEHRWYHGDYLQTMGVRLLQGRLLDERELHSRFEVLLEQYVIKVNIEAETAADGSPADGMMDLLTVILHEMGHVLGYGHVEPEAGDYALADDVLEAGMRLLPGIEEFPAVYAQETDAGANAVTASTNLTPRYSPPAPASGPDKKPRQQ